MKSLTTTFEEILKTQKITVRVNATPNQTITTITGETVEALINAVKAYNQKTRQFFIKENTTPEEVLQTVVKRQEKYL